MTTMQAIQARHSVRSYLDKPIPAGVVDELQREIAACNAEGGLNIQLVTNEPTAFDGTMAHYGKFSGVRNYIALIGKKSSSLDERLGYYGERIVLKAQTLGLNTCWVALTFSKGSAKKYCTIGKDEKLVCVLSLGYGATQGVPHKSKPDEALCTCGENLPDWFVAGAKAAILAPTATNQQKFFISLQGDRAEIKSLGGFYQMVDLGIVKYHFEAGSGKAIGFD